MEQVIFMKRKIDNKSQMEFHQYVEWIFDLKKQEAMLYYMCKYLQSLRDADHYSDVLWHTEYITGNPQKYFAMSFSFDRALTINAIINQRNWIATLKRLNDGKELCYAD
jgi:hypothetical protein